MQVPGVLITAPPQSSPQEGCQGEGRHNYCPGVCKNKEPGEIKTQPQLHDELLLAKPKGQGEDTLTGKAG